MLNVIACFVLFGLFCLSSCDGNPGQSLNDNQALPTGETWNGQRAFPDDNPWNTDVSNAPIDPNSAVLIASIGLNTGLHPDFGTVMRPSRAGRTAAATGM